MKRTILAIAIAVAIASPLLAQRASPVYVTLWFDTEDYILPQDDDATKRLADLLTNLGVRATFKNGWGMVRASNTQPAITLRFEAYTKPEIVEYMKIFTALLDKYPDIDQTKLLDQIREFS